MQPPKPYREVRPWGEFLEFTRNTQTTVKIITVNPGQAFSLQHHQKRDEFWHIISGDGTIQIGTEISPIIPGQDHFIPKQTNHRVSADSSAVVLLEISFGEFDESDITRIEDRYGRVKT
jgi:mannose-6-phosphate isomerase